MKEKDVVGLSECLKIRIIDIDFALESLDRSKIALQSFKNLQEIRIDFVLEDLNKIKIVLENSKKVFKDLIKKVNEK